MARITVLHYDAFSQQPNQGNPAGIVVEGDSLTEHQMQTIAHKVGFNETVFVLSSDRADLRLRYFTPGHEMPLCGHATVASLYALKSQGYLGSREEIVIETQVGLLPIRFLTSEGQLFIQMKQGEPQFIPFRGSREALAESIGLTADELSAELPVVYGSTGAWTLLIPIASLDSFARMAPNNQQFPSVLAENPRASIHPFTFETIDPAAFMHGRHFSSPYSGTVEDPVTGTASGVMGAYYLTYVRKDLRELDFIVEQGQEIQRDGRVQVKVHRDERDELQVSIAGTAVFVGTIEIHLENDRMTTEEGDRYGS